MNIINKLLKTLFGVMLALIVSPVLAADSSPEASPSTTPTTSTNNSPTTSANNSPNLGAQRVIRVSLFGVLPPVRTRSRADGVDVTGSIKAQRLLGLQSPPSRSRSSAIDITNDIRGKQKAAAPVVDKKAEESGPTHDSSSEQKQEASCNKD